MSYPVRVCGRCHRPIPHGMYFKRSRKYGIICQRCLSKLWRKRGYAFELNFVKKLEKYGFFADRVPTSGAGKAKYPDVIAYNPKKRIAMAFELKTVDANHHKTFTVEKHQLVKAVTWLRRYYANLPVEMYAGVAVRFVLGRKVKSPIIAKIMKVHDPIDWSKVPDIPFTIKESYSDEELDRIEFVSIDIADSPDLPQISSISKRSRYIRKIRQKRKGEN